MGWGWAGNAGAWGIMLEVVVECLVGFLIVSVCVWSRDCLVCVCVSVWSVMMVMLLCNSVFSINTGSVL